MLGHGNVDAAALHAHGDAALEAGRRVDVAGKPAEFLDDAELLCAGERLLADPKPLDHERVGVGDFRRHVGLVLGEDDVGGKEAGDALAHARDPALEVRLVEAVPVGDRLEVLGWHIGIEHDGDASQHVVLLHQHLHAISP